MKNPKPEDFKAMAAKVAPELAKALQDAHAADPATHKVGAFDIGMLVTAITQALPTVLALLSQLGLLKDAGPGGTTPYNPGFGK